MVLDDRKLGSLHQIHGAEEKTAKISLELPIPKPDYQNQTPLVSIVEIGYVNHCHWRK